MEHEETRINVGVKPGEVKASSSVALERFVVAAIALLAVAGILVVVVLLIQKADQKSGHTSVLEEVIGKKAPAQPMSPQNAKQPPASTPKKADNF